MINKARSNFKTALKTGKALVILALALLVLAPACGTTEPEEGLSSVSIGFSPMQFGQGLGNVFSKFQDAYNPYPSVISEMVVTVTYRDPGLKTIRKKIPGKNVSGSMRIFLEVPSGPDRTFRIEAYDRVGKLMFSGETTVDLSSDRVVTPVDLTLAFSCQGTAWDAERDTLPRLAKKIGLDSLGLGFLAGQIDFDITEEYDLISLALVKTATGIRIIADFNDTLDSGNFSGAVLLDTDNNISTPANGNAVSQLFAGMPLGADFLVLIQPDENAVLIDLSTFTGILAELPDAGSAVSIDIRNQRATIDVPQNLTGNIPGVVGFFGIFGSDGIPTDLAPDWGVCLSE
ncbi:MAG: hypothetical protein PHE84_02940 [bacterium]|nr:hypothetical protein [bacterium]